MSDGIKEGDSVRVGRKYLTELLSEVTTLHAQLTERERLIAELHRVVTHKHLKGAYDWAFVHDYPSLTGPDVQRGADAVAAAREIVDAMSTEGDES